VLRSSRHRVRLRLTEQPPVERDATGAHVVSFAPLALEIDLDETHLRWALRNEGSKPVAVDGVAVTFHMGRADSDRPPVMLLHGYQSWSPTRAARLGVDADPSRTPGSIDLVRAAFHADPTVAEPGELRAEQVTVLAVGSSPLRCVGFDGGTDHAGTIRARIVDDRIELTVEAWLGGATLAPGSRRELHGVTIEDGDDASVLLERWAARVGAAADARIAAPFLVGWCSWYQYFHDVTERALLDNLARADDWPFDVFQLDDGFQRAIGDWLTPNDKFPSGIEGIATAITTTGRTPGLWLAPFLVAPDSETAQRHPEWLARARHRERFAIGMYHEVWGGVMWELDTTRDDVLAHLEATARALVDAGYRYLKLDFTFSAAMPGSYADAAQTPAQRVRAGYDAIRRGAGSDVLILGCGAPLGAVVGAVDATRIGQDVAPWWDARPDALDRQPGYADTTPATRHAFESTCARSFMHRRLWSNDPDCVMLRHANTELSVAETERWARTVGASGGLVLVSDELSLLTARDRRLLDEVIEVGRAADASAIAGAPARCVGLLDPAGPRALAGSSR
jgi:alpha-galactosidase